MADDMQKNLEQTREKCNALNAKLAEFSELLAMRKLKSSELFAEIDSLLDALDKLEAKFTGLECVSHEPDVIRAQIDDVQSLCEEFGVLRARLSALGSLSKQLIRGRDVEDSIELKEKLNAVQIQAETVERVSSTKLNEIEQAYAIAKAFADSCKELAVFFEEVGGRCGQQTWVFKLFVI